MWSLLVDTLLVASQVIHKPMDLGTIIKKLKEGDYGSSIQSYREDVLLVFDNAIFYHDEVGWFAAVVATLPTTYPTAANAVSVSHKNTCFENIRSI